MTDSDSAPDSTPAQGRIAWRCICFNARKASRDVTQLYDRMLAPSGIRATQFTMLGALALTGSVTMSDLAARLGLDRTTLTRNLKLLEASGLIDVSRGRDRRERIVCLTAEGDRAVRRAMPHWRRAQDRMIAAFGAERWRRMVEDLAALADLAEIADE